MGHMEPKPSGDPREALVLPNCIHQIVAGRRRVLQLLGSRHHATYVVRLDPGKERCIEVLESSPEPPRLSSYLLSAGCGEVKPRCLLHLARRKKAAIVDREACASFIS